MERLTIQEEEVMQVIWKLQKGVIKDFLTALNTDIPYTTLASVVKNLERKNYVTARKEGLAYVYSPKVKQEAYKKKFLDNVVENYFQDSYKNMVSFFVANEKINVHELEEILQLIKKGK